jgi:hypothetical protein
LHTARTDYSINTRFVKGFSKNLSDDTVSLSKEKQNRE